MFKNTCPLNVFMAGYIEKKKIAGKTYFYLTENKRVGGKWKKTRKYLGVHTPTGFEKPRKAHPKSALSKKELKLIEGIKRNYSKKHKIGLNLWKEIREQLVSFVFNTNAIEGSSLSLEDTDSVLLGKKIKANKNDILAAKNMKKCIDFIFKYNGEIDEKLVLKLHSIEMNEIMHDAGTYRNVDVRVGQYICPRHEEVPKLMTRFFDWYRILNKKLHPFELAALTHLKFVRIHPFRDGNGRMARLLMNFVLLKNGYPLLNILNTEKMLYYLVLQKVDVSKRSKSFVKYLHDVYIKQYVDYLKSEK